MTFFASLYRTFPPHFSTALFIETNLQNPTPCQGFVLFERFCSIRAVQGFVLFERFCSIRAVQGFVLLEQDYIKLHFCSIPATSSTCFQDLIDSQMNRVGNY
jgi:hypothetical protein